MKGEEALTAAVRTLAAALAGGLPLPEALAVAAGAAPAPLTAPLHQAGVLYRLGASLPKALAVLAPHCPPAELDLLVRALQLGQRCGGGLPRLLAGLALVLQQRRQLREAVRARCTEARATAVVLALLPLLFCVYLLGVDPGFLAPLWQLPTGRLALGYAVVSWGAGAALAAWLVRPPDLR